MGRQSAPKTNHSCFKTGGQVGRQMVCPFACSFAASGEPNPFLKQTIYGSKRAGKWAGNLLLKQTIYGSKRAGKWAGKWHARLPARLKPAKSVSKTDHLWLQTGGQMGRQMACPFACPFEAFGEPNPVLKPTIYGFLRGQMGRQVVCPFACPFEASGEPNPLLKPTIYGFKRAGKWHARLPARLKLPGSQIRS